MKNALRDDLNTPQALASLSKLEGAIDSGGITTGSQDAFREFLEWVDKTLGLKLGSRKDIESSQKSLIAERGTSRTKQDWTRSDSLRDALRDQGIEVKDTSRGQIWFRNTI